MSMLYSEAVKKTSKHEGLSDSGKFKTRLRDPVPQTALFRAQGETSKKNRTRTYPPVGGRVPIRATAHKNRVLDLFSGQATTNNKAINLPLADCNECRAYFVCNKHL